jgi:pimeloyl-ACP methyl ester carboxylesterase
MPKVTAGLIQLAYDEQNGQAAETVVFVHGYLATRRYWRPTLRHLPAGLRAVTLDLRGTGDSDRPADGYTMAQYAADVFGLTQALGLRNFTLCGHSLGGAVALEFAFDHQDLLKALILVGAGVNDDLKVSAEDRARMVTFRQNEEALRPVLRAAFVRPLEAGFFEGVVEDARQASDGHFFQAVESLWGLRQGPRLPTLRVPTLIVGGDRDPFVPPATMITTYQAIPGCGLHMFHGVGHAPNVEVAERFAEVVADFVAEVNSTPGGAS